MRRPSGINEDLVPSLVRRRDFLTLSRIFLVILIPFLLHSLSLRPPPIPLSSLRFRSSSTSFSPPLLSSPHLSLRRSPQLPSSVAPRNVPPVFLLKSLLFFSSIHVTVRTLGGVVVSKPGKVYLKPRTKRTLFTSSQQKQVTKPK